MLLLMWPLTAGAHPPSGILLTYDADSKVLHVDVSHVSRDHIRHHIRKITIYRNGMEVMSKYFHQQIDPAKFTQDFPVNAEAGDVLKIEAFSTQGGSLEETLTVSGDAVPEAPPVPTRSIRPAPDVREPPDVYSWPR